MRTAIWMFLSIFILSPVLFPVYSQNTWRKTFGGIENDESYFVQQTNDGGFILTGYTRSFGAGQSDLWLLKTDSNGDTLWSKTYGHNSLEEGVSVQPTSDGGYIVVGFTSFTANGDIDIWLLKTDSNGNAAWTKRIGGVNNGYGNIVQQTSDGGYIIFGSTESFGAGNSDFWLVKTDSNGDTTWTRTFGGVYHDIAFSGQITSDDGFILAGYTQLNGFNNSDLWLIKTDSSGDLIWAKSYGGSLNELANDVRQTSDNGYIVTGYTASYGAGNFDIYLIKTNANGDSLWTKTFGGASVDIGQSVRQTSDNGFILAGLHFEDPNGSQIWLIKTDNSGNTQWVSAVGGEANDLGFSVVATVEGDYVVAGFTESFGAGSKDVLLMRLDANGQTAVNNPPARTAASFQLWQNFPNPFNPSTRFQFRVATRGRYQFSIYDLLGRKLTTLLDSELLPNTYTLEWDGRDGAGAPVASGVYIYRLSRTGESLSGKALLLR